MYKKLLLLSSLFIFGLSAYIVGLNNNLSNSLADDLNSLQSEYEMLKDSLETMKQYTMKLEESKNKIQVIYRTVTTPPIIITTTDTIHTVSNRCDQFDPNVVFEVPFSAVDRREASFFNTKGMVRFKWNCEANEPIDVSAEILNSDIRLNIETDIQIERNRLTIIANSPYGGVDISDVLNNEYDLNEVHRARPYRWGIGIVGGYGITNTGTTPFIGAGVTYTFFGLK